MAFATGFLRFFLDYGLFTYLPLLVALRYSASATTSGWLIAASAVGSIATAIAIGHIHERAPPERLLALAFLLAATGLVMVPMGLWPAAFGAFLFGLGNGLISPLQKSLLTRRTAPNLRGGVVSVDRVIQQISKSMAPALMGALLLFTSLEAVFWCLAAMSAAGMMALLVAGLARERLGIA
jgi:predicted MFS family arabinose efflux permease